ncbi:MAG: hypothetical protein HQL20_02265 [Candidatus Omnitrophica bacterium]|nr:hypothetical protein [Candidatus Omnitrophota bacterium]
MLCKPKKNESGIVLVIVITFVLIMSVAMVGLFSRNVSMALSGVEQGKRIKAEMLARGGYWKAYSTLSGSPSQLPSPNPETVRLDGINYEILYVQGAAGQVNVVVNYQ